MTLFLSGNLAENEPEVVQKLAAMKTVEIGGHTYNAFLPPWKHLLFDFIFRSYCGPRLYQKSDIGKTLRLHPVCWEILDGMKSLEKVFEELSAYEGGFVSETIGFRYRHSSESWNP